MTAIGSISSGFSQNTASVSNGISGEAIGKNFDMDIMNILGKIQNNGEDKKPSGNSINPDNREVFHRNNGGQVFALV